MFNQAILIGNLGQDPDTRYTPTGTAYSKFSSATTKRFTKDGEAQEVTTWHNIIAWGKLGEICGKYLEKGKQVMVKGEIQHESWEKDGVKHYRTVIRADEMKMLGRKGMIAGGESPDNYSSGDKSASEDDFLF